MPPLKGTCLAQTFTSSAAVQFVFRSRPHSIQLICSSCLSVCPIGETSHIYTYMLKIPHQLAQCFLRMFQRFSGSFISVSFCSAAEDFAIQEVALPPSTSLNSFPNSQNPAGQSSVCCQCGLNYGLQSSSLPPRVTSGTATLGRHPNFQEMCRKCGRNECRALTDGSVHIHMHMRHRA